jgi:transcriptional regulator
MYNPVPFVENRKDVLHAFIRQRPLATIVTCGPDGPEATHAPVVLHADLGPKGVLRCHLARANDLWKSLQISASVLAIFHGAEHYITPSWYPSKQEHGKVVPTWNYVAVHVRGHARIFDDSQELLEHLKALTDGNERAFQEPWSVSNAPQEYVEALSRAIVGIEISIYAIEGKWKVSQNRSEADRKGVVAGLSALGSPASIEMAQLVQDGSVSKSF